MAVLARSRALLRRRPSAAATTSAACPRCRHASAAAAKKPSPWDIDLRPKQAKGDGAAADGAAQQQRKAPPPRAFSAIVSSELSDALAAMEVYAPNEMQAVRCLRPCRHSIGRPRLTAVTPPPPLPALLAGSPQDALTVALEEPDRDALFVSQTGSGKTLMFLLPLLEQLGGRQHASDADATSALPQPRAAAAATLAPHGLIIVPTPDLAVQVHSVASTLAVAMPSPLAVEILNGTPLSSSSSSSSSGGGSSSSSSGGGGGSVARVVVATSDQLHDHLQRHALSTHQLRLVAVDEVDAVFCTRRIEDAPAAMERAVSSAAALHLQLSFHQWCHLTRSWMTSFRAYTDRSTQRTQGAHSAEISAGDRPPQRSPREGAGGAVSSEGICSPHGRYLHTNT
jgi:hypothetical protein